MTEAKSDQPKRDPTKTPKAPRRAGENMPPAGGESMQPADSRRPAAKPGATPEDGDRQDER